MIDLTNEDEEDFVTPSQPRRQPIPLPPCDLPQGDDLWHFVDPSPNPANYEFQTRLSSVPMAPGMTFTGSTNSETSEVSDTFQSDDGYQMVHPSGEVPDLEGMLELMGVVGQMGASSGSLPVQVPSAALGDWTFLPPNGAPKLPSKEKVNAPVAAGWAFPLPPQQPPQQLLPPVELLPSARYPTVSAPRPPIKRVPSSSLSRNTGTIRPPSKPTMSSRPDFLMASYNPKSPMASPTKKRATSPTVAASDLTVVSSKLPLVRQPKGTPERKSVPPVRGSPSRVPMFALSRKVVQAFKAQKAERLEEMSKHGVVGPNTLRTHKKSPSTTSPNDMQFQTQTPYQPSHSHQERKASGSRRNASLTPNLSQPSQSFMDQNWTFPSSTPILHQEAQSTSASALGAYTLSDGLPIGGPAAPDGDAWLLDLFGLPSQTPTTIPGALDVHSATTVNHASSTGLTPFLDGGMGWSASQSGPSSENSNWDVGAKRNFDSVVTGDDDSLRAAKRVRL